MLILNNFLNINYFNIHNSWFFAFSLQQVETVGDKYMAVSGLPETCDNHAKCIARLALDMLDMAKNVKMGSEPVVSKNVMHLQNVLTKRYFNRIYDEQIYLCMKNNIHKCCVCLTIHQRCVLCLMRIGIPQLNMQMQLFDVLNIELDNKRIKRAEWKWGPV